MDIRLRHGEFSSTIASTAMPEMHSGLHLAGEDRCPEWAFAKLAKVSLALFDSMPARPGQLPVLTIAP
jgi:hypothetical protein